VLAGAWLELCRRLPAGALSEGVTDGDPPIDEDLLRLTLVEGGKSFPVRQQLDLKQIEYKIKQLPNVTFFS